MSGELSDEHPHSENEAIVRASIQNLYERMDRVEKLQSLFDRMDKIEKQVDWLMDNILYHGKTLGNVMEDNPERWLK